MGEQRKVQGNVVRKWDLIKGRENARKTTGRAEMRMRNKEEGGQGRG